MNSIWDMGSGAFSDPRKITTSKLVYVCQDSMDWADELPEKYYSGLDGDMPEPIDKKLFQKIFTN